MIALGLCILLLSFIFQAATILVLEFRRPAHATAWLFILFLFPLVGFILYYFLATEFRRSRKARRRGSLDQRRRAKLLKLSRNVMSPDQLPASEFSSQARLFRALLKRGELPISARNRSDIFNNGMDTYEAMLKAIRSAKSHIHLSSYIVRDDGVGRDFQQALILKAQQGVKVKLLYDGIGSIKLKDSYVQTLQEGGVDCACFFPLRPSFLKKRMNYRNHRKIIVVDGLVGFIGGINVGDEYIGKHPRLGYWRDTHIKLEGDSVYWLQEVFLKDWAIATGEKPDDPDFFPEHDCRHEEPVQIVPAGPNRRGDAIHDSVFAMVSSAKERVWITTPYFIPSASIAMALHDAAISGLDVRIIIPYVPDTWLVHFATMSYVEEMMRSGVRVWQYKKGFVHAKTLVVDRFVSVIGSANMDLRSFYSNFEINAHLFDPAAITRVEQDFMQDLADSEEINLQRFLKRSRTRKVKEALARILSPLL
ncbi:cardiolipin synthase [Cohnella cholangitidis]|uniref:Cardiolipin synthase n=1 Tax=Cohnella cholangitidis TaxID=2598458 RepID=A0A7G5C210_9BACL|nr:cardiolipin synthase [Cohnella cholangitidis]QMV43244.1 cardiolipin synthase [Cohnella cholangitidis]